VRFKGVGRITVPKGNVFCVKNVANVGEMGTIGSLYRILIFFKS